MARYTVIEDTSETLLAVLNAAVARAIPAPGTPVVRLDGPEFAGLPRMPSEAPVITVWLYRIAPEGEKRNGPRGEAEDK